MPPRDDRNTPAASLLIDLFAQLFSAATRIDARRYCIYNGFLGLLLLGGVVVLRFSGPPDLLGGFGFAFVGASAALLLAAVIVRATLPRLVPALLAAQGAVVIALTVGFALSCAAWALGNRSTRAFRYLPGLIVVGTTYGAALCADFGPGRARPRPWRLSGFITGIAIELVVAALVVGVLLRSSCAQSQQADERDRVRELAAGQQARTATLSAQPRSQGTGVGSSTWRRSPDTCASVGSKRAFQQVFPPTRPRSAAGTPSSERLVCRIV